MTLNFTKNLHEALENINFKEYHEFIVYEQETVRDVYSSCGIVERYGQQKWKIIDLLNDQFSSVIKDKFDLYNWLNHNQNDELAYFLNEAGSNSLNHSDFKAPAKFQVWVGEKGFIVGIEQKGKGFDALEVDYQKIKKNEGAAFDFFRNCQNEVFFDNPKEAKTIYFEWKIV